MKNQNNKKGISDYPNYSSSGEFGINDTINTRIDNLEVQLNKKCDNTRVEGIENLFNEKYSGLEKRIDEKYDGFEKRVVALEKEDIRRNDRIFTWKTLGVGAFLGLFWVHWELS